MSTYALFIAAPFVLRTRREISALAVAEALTIFVAGICFLLIPARLAFPTPSDSELGIWRALFRYADRLNLDYNLVPSLHVALSFVCIELFAPRAAPGGRLLLRTWGGLIGVATVLTHQHHVVDAVTGYLLAWAAVKGVGRSQHRLGQE
jgi:membrane-associated phospholipid phosphatase